MAHKKSASAAKRETRKVDHTPHAAIASMGKVVNRHESIHHSTETDAKGRKHHRTHHSVDTTYEKPAKGKTMLEELLDKRGY